MIANAVGESNSESPLAHYEKHQATYREFSPYAHVTPDDPALMMIYNNDMTYLPKNAGHGIHHPIFGLKMKENATLESNATS